MKITVFVYEKLINPTHEQMCCAVMVDGTWYWTSKWRAGKRIVFGKEVE